MGKTIIRKEITNERLLTYLDECIDIFNELNIYVPEPILFKEANTIAWFGQACYLDNSVTLSSYILNDPEDKIKPVIIHELAHLAANDVEPGCGHRGAWKQMTIRLSNYTGYDIQRTDSTKNHDEFLQQKIKARDARAEARTVYKFACPSCGSKLTYYRKTRFVKTFDVKKADGSPAWWCGRCAKNLHQHVGFILIK